MPLPFEANPALADSLEAHRAAIMEGGEIPALTKELCAAMVAALTFCRPALVEHRRRARGLGASAQMLSEIWDNARSQLYDDAQRAALAAAVALTREPRALPETIRAQLQANYSPAQIVELTCAIGLANYLTRVRNALEPATPA